MGSHINKYSQKPDIELDFHGLTVIEARKELFAILDNTRLKNKKVRIITGKGTHSANGIARIKNEIKHILKSKNLDWKYAKAFEGGDGAIEFVIK